MTRTPYPPGWRAARAASAALLALAAACADDSPAPPTSLVPPDDGSVLAVLRCEVRLPADGMSCVDEVMPGITSASRSPAGGPRLEQRTLGGQGVYVRLASNWIVVADGVISVYVTVQNLANLTMATEDGAVRHTEGLRIFFSDGPTPTGAGTVSIANATGTAFFTGADQSYFQYGGSIGGTDQAELGADGILSSEETSASKPWQFNVAPGVTSFSFVVYVRTQTPPGALVTAAPQVTAISADTLVPGQTVTLTGTNFHPAYQGSRVRIGGVEGWVTGGGATWLNVVVPCVASGTVPVQVVRGWVAGAPVQRPLLARQRTLGVGEFVIAANEAESRCNEITASGVDSKYIVAIYDIAERGLEMGVEISGNALGEASPAPVVSPSHSPSAPPFMAGGPPEGEDAHYALLEKNRAEYARLSARFARDPRMRSSVGVGHAEVVAPPETRTFYVSNINVPARRCSDYYVASATRVYYSGKIAIYEDDATPAGLKSSVNPVMQDYYNKIGDQFNADIEPLIRNNFGDPLRRDAVTDNNGVLVALFTPLLNNSFHGLLGMVLVCDQYPRGGSNLTSNFGEYFYGYQPTTAEMGYYGSPDHWYVNIRSVLVHETKHLASIAARVELNVISLEETWLEEATAQVAEELWGRQVVDGIPWKGNTGYGSAANPLNLYCDARFTGPCSLNPRRPAAIMQRHFLAMYTYMTRESGVWRSPLGHSLLGHNGSSWSLVRYVIDRYGVSDAAFLTALTGSRSTGAAKLAALSGVPVEQLMGGWALSLVADDYPGLDSPSLDIQIPTWNFRDIYAGLQADGYVPLAYPLAPIPLPYGALATFGLAYGGGGVRWFQFSGVQTAPQVVGLVGSDGGPDLRSVRVAIARVQ